MLGLHFRVAAGLGLLPSEGHDRPLVSFLPALFRGCEGIRLKPSELCTPEGVLRRRPRGPPWHLLWRLRVHATLRAG